MPARRTVDPNPKPPEPVEFTVEFTGVGSVKMYGCPKCGRNGQDKKLIAAHIKEHGGEA
jgi:hypothetical protein